MQEFVSLEQVRAFFAPLAQGMPSYAVWIQLVVLFLLGAAALYDMFRGRVPDVLILSGFLFFAVAAGLYVSWPFVATRLVIAFCAAVGLYALNAVWFKLFHRDALGMGDAKWTALALSAFPPLAVGAGWVIGACGALVWMGLASLVLLPVKGSCVKRVYMGPFLFMGLVAAGAFLPGGGYHGALKAALSHFPIL